MNANRKILERFESEGRVWLRNAVAPNELRALERLCASDGDPGRRLSNNHSIQHTIRSATFSCRLRNLWPSIKPVRLLFFDKTPATNWGVAWHQDRVIAVNGHARLPGFTNWSQKSGTWHCQPPVQFLDRMIFVRVHLDRSTEKNGPMEIALGSHRAGIVPANRAADIAKRHDTELTIAEPGDILVLAMLTLHRSAPSQASGTRKTLRIDYSADILPKPLDWAF